MSSNDVADHHVAKSALTGTLQMIPASPLLPKVVKLPRLGLEIKMFLMGCKSKKPEV